MKTKINEVPLVGPRGRKEIIERVNSSLQDVKEINSKLNFLDTLIGTISPITTQDAFNSYFYFLAEKPHTKIYFRQSATAAHYNIPPLTVKASVDGGKSWKNVTATPSINGSLGTLVAEISAGEKLLIKGTNSAYGFLRTDVTPSVFAENCNFWANEYCSIRGNIMSLIGGDDFTNIKSVGPDAFTHFFSTSGLDGNFNGTSLNWDWVRIYRAALVLPATILNSRCYRGMFSGCTGITEAPNLPATGALPSGCYYQMFSGCSNLKKAPYLPATSIGTSAYTEMFMNCTSLSFIETMLSSKPGSTLAKDWVKNVSPTGTIVLRDDSNNWSESTTGIPAGWTVERVHV